MKKEKKGNVFLTARFRSGSTLLWTMFKQLSGFVSYYEPLHDNLIAYIDTNVPPQESHVGVTGYWDEYRRISKGLRKYHSPYFGIIDLLLEENDHQRKLEKYIRFLLTSRKKKRKALQINRADFRLPWLQSRFPGVTSIHLYRNPRDQWISSVRHLPRVEWEQENLNAYELMVWSCDLAQHFPFLAAPYTVHPYKRFYYLWRLSYLMGQRCSTLSLSFDDDLQKHPDIGIKKLAGTVGLSRKEASAMSKVIERRKVSSYRKYLPASWFKSHEEDANKTLKLLGLEQNFGLMPLEKIRKLHSKEWKRYESESACKWARDRLLVSHSAAMGEYFEMHGNFKKSFDELHEVVKCFGATSENHVKGYLELLDIWKSDDAQVAKLLRINREQVVAYQKLVRIMQNAFDDKTNKIFEQQ